MNTHFLAPTDPHPVERVNWESRSPILLVCEHAGRLVPARLGDLGVGEETLGSHRGWDLHAEKLVRAIAEILNAPLIIQRYSRLVIDSNRPPGSRESIPLLSDGVCIAGNANLSEADNDARIEGIFKPFDEAIVEGLDLFVRTCVFSIHTFTPVFGGEKRSMHAGFLTRKSTAAAQQLMECVAALIPDLTLALNEPYQIDDETDWLVPAHLEPRGLTHCLIEIRNDQISGQNEIDLWAEALSGGMLGIAKGVS